MRLGELLSPSNEITASTMCSSTLGPAMPPSLLTCPTMISDVPSALIRPIRAEVHSRTWVTLPGADVAADVYSVCMESIIRISGEILSYSFTIESRKTSF